MSVDGLEQVRFWLTSPKLKLRRVLLIQDYTRYDIKTREREVVS